MAETTTFRFVSQVRKDCGIIPRGRRVKFFTSAAMSSPVVVSDSVGTILNGALGADWYTVPEGGFIDVWTDTEVDVWYISDYPGDIAHPLRGNANGGATTVGDGTLTYNKLSAQAKLDVKAASGTATKVTLAAGTAAATPVTVSGMASGDVLISVLSFTTAAAIATVADRTSEYAVGTGQITKAGGTNETNNQLLIIWTDASA